MRKKESKRKRHTELELKEKKTAQHIYNIRIQSK